MTAVDQEVAAQLADLARRYADGCDRRCIDTFLDAFAPDGVLEVVPVDGPTSRIVGHAELAVVPERLRRWSATVHDVRDADYTLTGASTAAGEVHCLAHHLTHTIDGTEDRIMEIRYVDQYRCDDGEWRIAHRRVEVQSVTEGPFDA